MTVPRSVLFFSALTLCLLSLAGEPCLSSEYDTPARQEAYRASAPIQAATLNPPAQTASPNSPVQTAPQSSPAQTVLPPQNSPAVSLRPAASAPKQNKSAKQAEPPAVRVAATSAEPVAVPKPPALPAADRVVDRPATTAIPATAVAAPTASTPPPEVSDTIIAPQDALGSQTDQTLLSDSDFLSALTAYRTRAQSKFPSLLEKTKNHPLSAYVQLWELLLKARSSPEDPQTIAQLQSFLDRHEGTYVAERARADWIRIVAETDNVPLFTALWNKLQWNKTESDISCHRAYFQLRTAKKNKSFFLSQAKELLRDTKTPQAQACRRLSQEVLSRDPDWGWIRILILMQQKRFKQVRETLLTVSPRVLPTKISELFSILDNPDKWHSRNARRLGRLPARVLAFAALRQASDNTAQAAQLAGVAQNRLNGQMRALLWGRIGYQAALDHDKRALEWFARAGTLLGSGPYTIEPDQVLVWQARAALRSLNWAKIERAVNALPAPLRDTEAWTYWKGRALLARKHTKTARRLLLGLTKSPSFYGLLACDALNVPYYKGKPDAPVRLTPMRAAQLASIPSVKRALSFYELNLIYEGNREWNWALADMKSRERIEMALFAQQKGIVHRMINTTVSSGQLVFSLTYPLVHEQEIRSAAKSADLPAAWVFGLIRQESRFVSLAKSSVGAQGLMQVMPRTARWVAKRVALNNYLDGHLMRLDTNLLIGTQYLKLVHDSFEASIPLSTASYNAGPSRAQTWRSTLIGPTEGAVFAETIPFGETRDYVMRVAANTVQYSRYESKPFKLSDIMGKIVPSPVSQISLP